MKITLCGSTRFRKEFEEANRRLTLAGHVVYSVAYFGHSGDGDASEHDKTMLDLVHLRKILLSDLVYVVGSQPSPDKVENDVPYIGFSTGREIMWADVLGIPVVYEASIRGRKWAEHQGFRGQP